MFDADYENYLQEVNEAYQAAFPGRYETKNSGEMAVHSDGVKRDRQTGKTLYTLMFPKGVPMDRQLIVRVAELYTRGGARYGNRNWENSEGEDTLEHHTEALWRHFMKFFFDVQDGEDHAAAIVWNINSVEQTRRHIAEKLQDEKDVHRAEAEAAWPDVQDSVQNSVHFCWSWTWREGDALTETDPKGGEAGTWHYSKGGDVWYFQDSLSKMSSSGTDLSARSLKNLVAEFGPLRVTKGFRQGLILYPDGSVKYDH